MQRHHAYGHDFCCSVEVEKIYNKHLESLLYDLFFRSRIFFFFSGWFSTCTIPARIHLWQERDVGNVYLMRLFILGKASKQLFGASLAGKINGVIEERQTITEVPKFQAISDNIHLTLPVVQRSTRCHPRATGWQDDCWISRTCSTQIRMSDHFTLRLSFILSFTGQLDIYLHLSKSRGTVKQSMLLHNSIFQGLVLEHSLQ